LSLLIGIRIAQHRSHRLIVFTGIIAEQLQQWRSNSELPLHVVAVGIRQHEHILANFDAVGYGTCVG
jgi:hypothetical protein